jgi:Bacteriophage head to tail connecting protein
MSEPTGSLLMRRWGTMDAEFQRHATVWRACFEATYPERADGLQGDVVDASSAQNKRAELMDDTGTDSARLLTSTVNGGMTPANSLWFGMDVGEETDEERRWLDDCASRMWEAIHGSNYDAQKFEAVLDSVCAGWFVLYIDEVRDTGELDFQQWPLSQCRIASSKAGGRVDTLYRRFKLTAEQAVNEYGDKVSERVKRDAAEKPDTQHEFLHAIYPRSVYAPGSRMAKNLPIASCHVECQTKALVRESGYHENPIVVARWMQLPNSPYAVGPVAAALPTIRSLNKLLEMEAIAVARAAVGTYVAEDDGVLNPRTVKVKGGAVIVANSVDSIKPLPSGADFNVSFSKADQMRAQIRRLMMADQLPPADGPVRTATEFHARIGMIRQLLGPLFGRFQAEDLAPTITRVFGLMYRRGRPELGGMPGPVLLDDAPQSLQGTTFRVRFQSPLARAQKMENVQAMERLALIAQNLAAAGKGEALDLLDGDEILRESAEALGAPDKALKDEKAVAAYRQAKQEQAQAEQQQAQQAEMQTMAADAAFKRAAAA